MRLGGSTRRGSYAPALPVPYPALTARGLRVRRGQLSLTVAAPGVGKTMFWHNIAHRMGVPTLYCSADTDQHDVTVRAMALWSELNSSEVEARLVDPGWRDYLESELSKSRHIDWAFESTITPEFAGERLNAYGEVHGQYPQLVVIDNLSNTVVHQSDEFAEQKEVVKGMQELARLTKAHVALLHHAKGEYETGNKPIPQGGSSNNLFKLPEVGLTMHSLDDGVKLGVNIVKNRGGQADPAAKRPVVFNVDYGRAAVLGFA